MVGRNPQGQSCGPSMNSEQRLQRLQDLLEGGDFTQATRLTYEWVKTGVFTHSDLARALALVYELAYNDGRDSMAEEEVVIEGL